MSFRGRDDFLWLSLALMGIYSNLSSRWAMQNVSGLGVQVSARDAGDRGSLMAMTPSHNPIWGSMASLPNRLEQWLS